MYERILVPLDGSEVGEAVLPYIESQVSKLSPEVETEVILLQVLSRTAHRIAGGFEGESIPHSDGLMADISWNATDYLDRVGETLRNKGVKVTAMVAVGDASKQIAKVAIEEEFDK